MCKGGEFDLSFESLTSHAIRQVLRELPTTDPDFFAELSQSRSHMDIVPSLTAEQVALEDAPSNNEIGPADDSDVPFLEVCAHHHESLNTTPSVDPAQLYVPNSTDGLMSTAVAEDTLIESVDGVVVDVTPEDDTRPTRRIRRRNVLYNKDWWADSRGSDDEEEPDQNDSEYIARRYKHKSVRR